MKNTYLNQKGQGAIEYGIVALIIVLIVFVITQPQLTTALNTVWAQIQAGLQ